jgi:hypothetical protein
MTIIGKVLVVFGYIFLLFALHEVYHLHNGVPQGICIGNCQNGNAQMVLYYNNLTVTDEYREKEENNAWAVSLSVIFIIGIVHWYCFFIRNSSKY